MGIAKEIAEGRTSRNELLKQATQVVKQEDADKVYTSLLIQTLANGNNYHLPGAQTEVKKSLLNAAGQNPEIIERMTALFDLDLHFKFPARMVGF